MANFLDTFVSGLKGKDGSPVTTVKELRENQFGFPLRHYAQQYLFGATGLRLQVFNSIQGQQEVGKSTLLFDLMGDACGAEEEGGLGGLAVLYEMEGKISPTILYSILSNHGERALDHCIPVRGMTLEQAVEHLNTKVVSSYLKACPNRDKPLLIGFDSIGGASSEDTVGKLKTQGATGKGYYDKQHFMKYFCENQGTIFARQNIPVVVVCINQEREAAAATPFGPPKKTITGGKAQMFKDGHMISVTKKSLASGDGNILYLKTTKTSFCDPRKIEVEFRWNRFGHKVEDAYEAKFWWSLASARCLQDPEKGVGEIRDICDVKVSDKNLVTCPQLGLKSVIPDEFEEALMSDKKLLEQLYTYQKIEKLKGLTDFAEYVKAQTTEPEKVKPEPKPKAKPAKDKTKAKTEEVTPLFDAVEEAGDAG